MALFSQNMLHTPCWKAEKTDFYVHSKNSTEMAREFCGERGVTVKASGIPQQAVSTFV